MSDSYTCICKDPVWQKQLEQLRKDKIPYEEIDQGFQVFKKDEQTGKMVVERVGAGDHKLECEEIAETTVNNYERYHEFLRTLTGRPIGWTFDDFDPETVFDEEIRNRLKTVIEITKEDLDDFDLDEESDEYKGRLATAVFKYLVAPKKEVMDYLKKAEPNLLDGLYGRPLTYNGQFGLRDYIYENGGLDIGSLEGRSKEYTALKAIQTGIGECTETAMIFYAAFKMAGLKPDF